MRMQPEVLLVLVVLVVGIEPLPASQEASVDRCVATSESKMEYVCNDGEYEITNNLVFSSKDVTIICKETRLNCSRFPSVDFGSNQTVNKLTILKCGIDEPMSCFLAKMKIADVKKVYLTNLLMPLTARHIEGLRATTHLLIYNTVTPSMQKPILHEISALLPRLVGLTITGSQLTLAPGLLQAPLLEYLELLADSISDLPPGSFRGLSSLDRLLLWNNAIVDINNDTFAGLEKVRKVDLTKNRISVLRGGALSPLRGLETLFLEKNPLRHLYDGFLQGLDHLNLIQISSSEPLILDPRAFADIKSLRYVILKECRLQELPSTVFQGSKAIQKLTLKNNRIERLHPEVFRDQTEMIRLDLSENQLTNIAVDLFIPLKKLEELYLSSNQLEIFPDALFSALTSLHTLSVANNKLTQIGATAFQGAPLGLLTPEEKNKEYYGTVYCIKDGIIRMQILDKFIEDVCQIWSLVPTEPNPSRHIMSQSNSNDDPFVGKHMTVDLRNNNISTIFLDSLSIPQQKTPAYFTLDQNPLKCDCEIYSFVKLATSSNHTQNSPESARCNAPTWLQGTGLTRLSLGDSVC
ncbi:hypothetical protein K1T71_014702 [Dendrolimus kikuchii]|uniref:Uncharacterized protein n=1 Tax=Dendrolimus kikuchii TaxID=765133 RepID=A0ACC1CEW6_9NEOP|nr:hypothetical protein K1T71_014702 [Dendrolimus kikuchii]